MSWVILQATETSLIKQKEFIGISSRLIKLKESWRIRSWEGQEPSQATSLQQYLITFSSGTSFKMNSDLLKFLCHSTQYLNARERTSGWSSLRPTPCSGKGEGAKTAAMGWSKSPQRTEAFLEKGTTDAMQTKTYIYYTHQVKAFHKPVNGCGTCPLEMRWKKIVPTFRSPSFFTWRTLQRDHFLVSNESIEAKWHKSDSTILSMVFSQKPLKFNCTWEK